MWDFSWLERRWPGAGYEDWDRALDELVERGYNAVRIDAYPHLIRAGRDREYELRPCWTTELWGAPSLVRVRPWPALPEFVARCHRRGIKVGLSSWWREDRERLAWRILSPAAMAEAWLAVLDALAAEGLLDALLYVDLSNEWPTTVWTPFYRNASPHTQEEWDAPPALAWMREAIGLLRERHPSLAYTFSTCTRSGAWLHTKPEFIDLADAHFWMIDEDMEFYKRVDYSFQTFSEVGYERLAERAEPLYRSDPGYWQRKLAAGITRLAAGSRACGLPFINTEGWATVVWKDGPLLDWGWVKELNAFAVEQVVTHGRWAGICTSNFCGPQFVGMWRDRAWHERLTRLIRSAPLDPGLCSPP